MLSGLHCTAADGFSPTREDPPYRLRLRLGAAAEEHRWVARRALAALRIAWLALLILSLAQGLAYGQQIQIPFLWDFAANVRFLFSVPLPIIAEIGIDQRLRLLVTHFVKSGLVLEHELPRFDAVIQKVTQLQDHALAELLMLALAYIPPLAVQNHELLMASVSSWHSMPAVSGHALSDAGWSAHPFSVSSDYAGCGGCSFGDCCYRRSRGLASSSFPRIQIWPSGSASWRKRCCGSGPSCLPVAPW